MTPDPRHPPTPTRHGRISAAGPPGSRDPQQRPRRATNSGARVADSGAHRARPGHPATDPGEASHRRAGGAGPWPRKASDDARRSRQLDQVTEARGPSPKQAADAPGGVVPAPPRPGSRRTKPNVAGIVGLVLGLAAIGAVFVPGYGYVAWPLAGVGLLLGTIGIAQAVRGKARGRKIAVAAVIVAVVAALMSATTVLFPSVFGARGTGDLHIPPTPGDRHQVDFVVSSADGAIVRYGTLNDQRTGSAPASTDDWHGHGSFSGGAPILTLTADTANASVANVISCAILVDGQQVASNRGSTIALCTANVE